MRALIFAVALLAAGRVPAGSVRGDAVAVDFAHWQAALLDTGDLPGFHTAMTSIPPNNGTRDEGAQRTLVADDRAATGRAEIAITLTAPRRGDTPASVLAETQAGLVLDGYSPVSNGSFVRLGPLGVGDADQAATFPRLEERGRFLYATYVDAFLQGQVRGLVTYNAFAPLAASTLLQAAATRQAERIRTGGALPAALSGAADATPAIQLPASVPSLDSAEGVLALVLSAAGIPEAAADRAQVRGNDCWKLAGLPPCLDATLQWQDATGAAARIDLHSMQTVVGAKFYFGVITSRWPGLTGLPPPAIGDEAALLPSPAGTPPRPHRDNLAVRRGRVVVEVERTNAPDDDALGRLSDIARRLDSSIASFDTGDLQLPPVTRATLPTFAGLAAIALGADDLPSFTMVEPPYDDDTRVDKRNPNELVGYHAQWQKGTASAHAETVLTEDLTVYSSPETAQAELQRALDTAGEEGGAMPTAGASPAVTGQLLDDPMVGDASFAAYVRIGDPLSGAYADGYVIVFRRGQVEVDISLLAEGMTPTLDQVRALATLLDGRLAPFASEAAHPAGA